ncbi:calnexin 14d-related [Anaeramoeba flamelloides]|uniref:Calnexin 14d-related n=1 Tax=Anaeramoeba flamelloides TaxID=1746091 RepID=A0ABQ8XYG1_9EUKA|nr:calnexin 14d-related [Anaeramoeba flamelloides]
MNFEDIILILFFTIFLTVSTTNEIPDEAETKTEFDFFLLDEFNKKQDLKTDKYEWTITKDPRYRGKWTIENSKNPSGVINDTGLVMKTEAALHGISKEFQTPFDPTSKGLIIQYELRYQEFVSCAGSYIKLLSQFDSQHFSRDNDYLIMFGPDWCGKQSNAVRFIYGLNDSGNDKEATATESKSGSEKLVQLEDPPEMKLDDLSHLYTLVIFPNQSWEIWVDLETVKQGSNLTKGFNGIEQKWINDPDDFEPEDWDENEYIEDPNAKTPQLWDTEQDGEWEAPRIENPDWEEWQPRKILNPNWNENQNGFAFQPIHGMGLELWSMGKNIMFDNILVTSADKINEVKLFANQTWGIKYHLQFQEQERKRLEEENKLWNRFISFSLSQAAKFTEFINDHPKIMIPAAAVFLILIFVVSFKIIFFSSSKTDSNANSNTNESQDKKNIKKVEGEEKEKGGGKENESEKEKEKEKEKEEEEEEEEVIEVNSNKND